MNRVSLILILGLMILGFVSGASVDEEILKEFAKGGEKVRVIVEKNNVQKTSIRTMQTTDDNIKKITENNEKFTALVSLRELEELRTSSKFSKIRRDIPLKIFMQDVVGIVDANQSWNLISTGINLTGAKQSICILDTGINRSHSDFSGRIIDEKCYCSVSNSGSGGCCPNNETVDDFADDDEGHGTHVAGIAGATGGIDGVATDVGLVIVKIMNATGAGTSSDMENAIQWCIDHAATYNISVITASLGDPTTEYTPAEQDICNDYSSELTTKINNAFAQNISITIASGNKHWTNGITWPACITNATAVGATNKTDSLNYNRNSLVKLLGIGVNINSTCIKGDANEVAGYCPKSGTSMATPVVAGAIVIINQFLELTGRIMTPAQIENTLYETGETISEFGNNYSRINVYNALLSLDNVAPNVTLVSPSNEHVNLSTNQSFVCNATDWQLANVTFKIWNSTGLYYNETKNLTGAENGTTFDLINMPEENYVWNCFAVDGENNLGTAPANFSLTVGGVEVNLNSPENNSATNVNETFFNCSSFSDADYELVNVSFSLWNSTGTLIKNETKNISGFENVTIFNYTFTMEDNYAWQCVAINNNSDMGNGDNFTVTYDVSIPTISDLTAENVGSSSATITWTTDEETNSSVGGDVSGSNSEYTTSHSVAISGLSALTLYSYNVTSCDRAGNCDNDTGSFTTTSAPSSGGGGGISAKTYVVEDKEFRLGKTEELKAKDKMIFSLASGRHELRALEVQSSSVDIMIESNPIYLTLVIGGETKLNMSSPLYYDLMIRLNSIRSRKANITITRILEEIEKEIVENETEEIVENETEDGDKIYHITEDEKTDYKPFIFGIVIALVVFIGILLKIKSKKLKASKTNDKYGKKTKAKAVGKG